VLVVGVDGRQFILDHFVRDADPLARQKRIGHDKHRIGTDAVQRQKRSLEAARIPCLDEVELQI
jgi:hypothetical protein